MKRRRSGGTVTRSAPSASSELRRFPRLLDIIGLARRLSSLFEEISDRSLARGNLRRAEMQAILAGAAAELPPPALHPNMAGVFEQKVRGLAAALEHEDLEQRELARSTMRGFIDRVVIPPGTALLQVVGNLGEMLTAAGAPLDAAAVGNSGCGGGI